MYRDSVVLIVGPDASIAVKAETYADKYSDVMACYKTTQLSSSWCSLHNREGIHVQRGFIKPVVVRHQTHA